MKPFLLFLLLLAPIFVSAQLTTANPDTVCYQTNGSIYQVPSLGPGYTYNWTVAAPGVLTGGQGTNSITVNWSAAAPGLINNGISVIATNATTSCQSTAVNLNVLILQIVPSIVPIGPFCSGSPCVALTGTPAGGTWSGPGIVGNQFCPNTSGAGTFNITYTVTAGGCVFTATTSVTVNPVPVLSPIQHN
jgi:hypothetical protein